MKVYWNSVIFFLAFGNRTLLVGLVSHWAALGTAALVGDPLDSVLWATPAVLLVSALITIALLVVLNRDGRVSTRMKLGARGLEGQSVPLILVGALSNVGGIVLLLKGAVGPALWSIGLGAALTIGEGLVLFSFFAANRKEESANAAEHGVK